MVKEHLKYTNRTAELSKNTGIELAYCEEAAGWAHDALRLMRGSELSPDEALIQAGDRILTLPRDQEDIPIFRVRYAASELLREHLSLSPPSDQIHIIPHYDRMEKLVTTLVDLQRNNEYPYDLPHAPVPTRSEFMPSEEILPHGTREHALYLWHACYWMGGGIESNIAFKSLTQLYTEHPELFKPEYVVEQGITLEQITEIISNYPALKFNLTRIQHYWIKNAHLLNDDYAGDPRIIYADKPGYRLVKKRLVNTGKTGFLGFQDKMASMYTHFLADADIIEEIPFAPPVDFHLLRLFIANEIITFENVPENGDVFNKKTIAMVRKMLFDYIITSRSSEVEVDDALWRYSKLMCAQAPGNATGVNRSAGRGKKSSHTGIDFSKPVTLKKYAQSCGRCAISATCISNISSGGYYADDRMVPQPRINLSADKAALFSTSDTHITSLAHIRKGPKPGAQNATPVSYQDQNPYLL